jgi:hypothetical protein
LLHFEVSRSVITVQREFGAWFKKKPHKKNVTRGYRQFVQTGCLCEDRRCFSEVPASQWLEQAENCHAKNDDVEGIA